MDKVTVPKLVAKKGKERIAAVTAYDYTSARLADEAGLDVILVGDSASMVMAGNPDTLGISLEEMLVLTRWASKGVRRALLVGDMPFGSYQESVEQGVRSAVAFIKAGAHAVKIEGGEEVAPLIERLVGYGIPVMGHVGLLPQRVHQMGGYPLQVSGAIYQDAVAVAEAGAFSIVLEKVELNLAKRITEAVPVPTIGIGSGPHCDGQILVFHDLLGLSEFRFKFVKTYLEGRELLVKALRAYAEEVRRGEFPKEEHAWRKD